MKAGIGSLLLLAACVGVAAQGSVVENRLIDQYGQPDRVETGRLIWHEKGRWKRITLWNTPSRTNSQGGPEDIEETIACPIPEDKRGLLAQFSATLRVSEFGTELSARSRSEDLNILALNLASMILDGKIKPAEARDTYDRTISLMAGGKSSNLTKGLIFPAAPSPQSSWPIRFRLSRDPMLRSPLYRNEPSSPY
jgi:hypothetical protein